MSNFSHASAFARLRLGAMALTLLVGAQPATAGPPTTILAPGDKVTNRLARLAPARQRRNKSLIDLLSSLFRPKPAVIGPPVSASEYPWQVALRISANGAAWRCGGILIAPQFVLTAAHCMDAADVSDRSIIRRVAPAMIEVFHGSRFYAAGTLHRADPAWEPIIHPGWKVTAVTPFAGDAALIRLSEPIQGVAFAPIQVATATGPKAVVSGWGRFGASDQASPVLRAVAVPLIDNAACASHLPANQRNLVSGTSLCAESKQEDACKGDSGGPLVIGSRQHPQTVGIVSWGPSESCGHAGPGGTLIGGYTRASAIASWVRSVTGDAATETSAPPDPLFSVNPIAVGGGPDR